MNITKLTTICLTILLISACSSTSQVEKKVAQEIKNEPAIKQTEIGPNVRDYISKSTTLTAEQKTKLLEIQTKTQATNQYLTDEMTKVKLVLMKTVVDPKASRKEIALLKKNLKKLNTKQFETTIHAFDQAHAIISPMSNSADKEFLYNSFLMREHSIY